MDLLDLLPDAVVVLDEGPVVAHVNRAAEAMLGRAKSDLEGRPCADVLHLRDPEGRDVCANTPIGRRLPMAKGLPERDFELTRADGTYLPVSMRASYVKDGTGVIRRAVCVLRDARARRGMDLRTVEVISTVSHEIRSPLTSIKGFTKTLLDRWERFPDDTKREMLQAVNEDADRVTRLLGELLDVSRLEAGRLRLRLVRTDLAEIAESVADTLRPRAEHHTIATSFDGPVIVLADADKVRQVLTNMIENALKYTGAGTVSVSGSADDTWATVEVADQGEGMSAAQLPRLFRKFYRRERAGSPTGTGLGLYICKGLIEAHGGEIGARSERGNGSVFWFRLPLKGQA